MHNDLLRTAATQHPYAIMQPYDALIEEHGFDAVCAMLDYFGGSTVYIPNKRKIFMGCLEKEIAKEYLNGIHYHDIIRKYHISERSLRRILA